MKFQNMIVDVMFVKEWRATVSRDRDSPLAIEFPVDVGGNPLQKPVRRRSVKSEIDLARIGIDPDSLYFRMTREEPFHLRAEIEQRL
jgi:hypothetical protein